MSIHSNISMCGSPCVSMCLHEATYSFSLGTALQVIWKLLSASGKPNWQTSQPIPVTASGTVTAAQIAVSPNATCTIALQTLEQPNSVKIFAMRGNPTLPSTGEEAVSAHCQPIGKVDAAEGQSIIQFLFQPQSAGVMLQMLHKHAEQNRACHTYTECY